MGVVKFWLVFDKPDKVYYSGEMVTGRVELVLNSRLKIRGVQLKIKGRAKCSWTENEPNKTVYRWSSEIYINSKQILIGGRDKFKLPEGEHTYPFAVPLPDDIPTSFTGRYGKISYYGKAKIDVPLGFDIEKQIEFTIIHPLNLILFPNLITPYNDEKSMPFCCLWRPKGLLTMVVRLPKTAFAATESIPITLEVDNASKVTVCMVHMYLRRAIRWIADGYEKIKDSKLRTLNLGSLEKGESKTWSGNFAIPSISFPNLGGSTIITMYHELHIKAVVSGFHNNLRMHVPVTIADVVVHNDSEVPTVTPQLQDLPNNMTGDSGIQMPAGEALPPYPNHNPPAGNHPCFENSGGVPFKETCSQICPSAVPDHVVSQPGKNNAPSNLSFSMPSTYQNAGGMPQVPIQENSVSVQQYPPQEPPFLPSRPPQPATNPMCSQNASCHPVADYGWALPSFNNDVQLENTPFLNDSKGQTAESVTDTKSSSPLSPSAPPPSYKESSQNYGY